MCHFSVLVQRIITGIKFPTNITHVLRITVSSYMKFQVPFHLETLSTVFAGEFVIVRVPSDVVRLQVVLRLRPIIAFITAV